MIRKHSVLLRRVFVVLIAAMLGMALITGGMFAWLSGQTFANLSRQELNPKVSALAGLLSRYQRGEISAEVLSAMVNDSATGESVLGAYAYAVDAAGNPILTSSLFESGAIDGLSALAQAALAGDNPTSTLKIDGTQLFCMAAPLQESGGAVVLCMPMVEQMAARNTFLFSLLIALAVSVPLSAICIYWATGRLLSPLTQIRQVAMDMASGKLDARANESFPGDVGDVGRSLNVMAGQLADSMYKTILERDRMEFVIDGLSEGIVSVDARGNIEQYNPAVERMFPGADPADPDPRMRLIQDERVWQDFDRVLATGKGITYQWQWRNGSSGTWARTTVSGNKTATISMPATAARNGYQYRCKITDSAGNVVYSYAVVLNVK